MDAQYEVVAEFGKLKAKDSLGIFQIGSEVAFLQVWESEASITYGLVYDTEYATHSGKTYKIITPDGHKWSNISSAVMVRVS